MAGTQIRMDRNTIVVDGTNKYQIIATCLIKGTLADTGIFVLNIITPDDPRDDTLLRVTSVADITRYGTNRDTAITAGATVWRSSQLIISYNDIETANHAWKELSARINTLVKNYDELFTEFETFSSGDIIVYPSADTETIDQLTNAFLATAAVVDTAEAARDAHIRECNEKQTALDVVVERLREAQADLDVYTAVNASLTVQTANLISVQAMITSTETNARALVNSSSASAAEITAINAQLTLLEAQFPVFSTTNAALTALNAGAVTTAVATLQARVSSLTTDRNNLTTELNRCNADSASLEAALDRARADRDAALAAVRAVCPDYVPPPGS